MCTSTRIFFDLFRITHVSALRVITGSINKYLCFIFKHIPTLPFNMFWCLSNGYPTAAISSLKLLVFLCVSGAVFLALLEVAFKVFSVQLG